MSDTAIEDRLRSEAADVSDWDGRTMKAWDGIRATVETHKGSDLPRLMFESLVESLAELMVEGADEIRRLQTRVTVLEMVIQEELDEFDCCDDANRMIVESIRERGAAVGKSLTPGASSQPAESGSVKTGGGE